MPASNRRCPRLLIGSLALAGATALLGAGACRRAPEQPRLPTPEALHEVVVGYADLALAEYTDSLEGARRLLAAVERFVEDPSAAGLDDARNAWLAARIPYVQTEVFRFVGGPIDRVEKLIDMWPLDERLIESDSGRPGIIDDAASYPELTEDVLLQLNMKDAETGVTTGYHAIEFLLWGPDTHLDGPGDRPFSDYLARAADPGAKGSSLSGATAERRRKYLLSATRLLVNHLSQVVDEWADGSPGNYRARLVTLDPSEAVGLIVKGIATFAGNELAARRLQVPHETRSPERETSRFSDSTASDVVGNAVGVLNLCLGTYQRPGGRRLARPGLCALVSATSPSIGRTLSAEIATGVALARAIPAPFDRAIGGDDNGPGRSAVQRAIGALEEAARTLHRAAEAIGARAPVDGTAP